MRKENYSLQAKSGSSEYHRNHIRKAGERVDKNSTKEMLEKQLQLLSEHSQKECDALTLCALSEAMVKISSTLALFL